MATTKQEVEPAAARNNESSSSSPPPVVLILGASGLDRLLTVPCYPQADSKVRTTSFYEVGGGNAANTAHTMALLAKARALMTINTSKQQQENNMQETAPSSSSSPLVVRLCSKVGDDDIGRKVVQELNLAGVDLSCPLFQVAKGTTTGLTTVIVSETEPHTRTCLYTPGSCGELTLSEATQLLQLSQDDDDNDTMMINKFFHNVVHFHSDARHTDVALFLARHAAKRGICVSVDVEKDRGTVTLDQLMQVADMIFTGNGQPVQDYLHRMHAELELLRKRQKEDQPPTPPPVGLSLHLPTAERAQEEEIMTAEEDEMNTYASALGPSMFFTRWYNQVGKQVVVTRGSCGAMHIVCDSIVEETKNDLDDDDKHCCDATCMPAINKLEMIVSPQQEYNHGQDGKKMMIRRRLQHTFSSSRHQSSLSEAATTTPTTSTTTKVATYSIQTTGVLQNVKVVDTTGAGDAFIGAFLLFRIAMQQQQQHQQQQQQQHDDDDNIMLSTTTTTMQQHQNCLDFASWVAGNKVQGPGARMALPTARDMDEKLGTSLSQIQESLGKLIGPFQFSSTS